MAISNPSIAEVGRKAKVHPSTVSRILNKSFESHRYSAKTVARVIAVAQELGYRPSQAGRTLRTGKTMQIGVLVPDITSVFFNQFIKHLEKKVWATGYRLLICCSNENAQQEQEYLSDLLSRGIDGLVVAPSDTQSCQQVITAGIPLVSVDRPLLGMTVPHVGLDNIEAGQMMGQHLIEMGYKHVMAVAPCLPNDPTLPQRCKGLAQGLVTEGAVLKTVELPSEATDEQLNKIVNFATAKPHTAIVGLTEDTTFRVYECLRSHGLSIPDDVGMGGIDDFPAARLVCPAISVIAQPIEQLAHKAFECLLEMINETEKASSTIESSIYCQLSPEFIRRESL
ncbi:MAG: LacI family DNA-binding transcriptional regulator [Phycisphaeraceae bacterium]|nr:LacI family DNA-binding transcriptional regulator [Phycisphaeraceae bacterium]